MTTQDETTYEVRDRTLGTVIRKNLTLAAAQAYVELKPPPYRYQLMITMQEPARRSEPAAPRP